MFKGLADKLAGVFDKLKGRGILTEDIVNDTMREIKIALLEADVALPVVKSFIASVKEKAVGQEVVKSVSPANMVVKIVNDALVDLLGEENTELKRASVAPSVYLMVGLQGSGKTTSSGKLAARSKGFVGVFGRLSSGGTRTTFRLGRTNRCRCFGNCRGAKAVGNYKTCFVGGKGGGL